MILKLFARWHSFKKLFWDDFCVIFAWILVLLTVIDWQIIIDDMLQWQALISGRLWPPPPTIIRTGERYYIGSIIALVLFFTSLWAVKISFLLFFRRLGRNVEGQSIIWWLVFTVTFSSYFVCIGLIQYSCLGSPVLELIKKPSLEIIEKCSKPGPVKFGQISVKTCGALDVVTDYMSGYFLFARAHLVHSSLWCSYGNPNQVIVGGPNVGSAKNRREGHFFFGHNHHCRSYSPHAVDNITRSMDRYILGLSMESYRARHR